MKVFFSILIIALCISCQKKYCFECTTSKWADTAMTAPYTTIETIQAKCDYTQKRIRKFEENNTDAVNRTHCQLMK